MVSTSNENKNHEFIKISKYLKSIGLSSPEIIKIDHKKGLFLIEDFGDLTFNQAIENNVSEELLYLNAVKCLSSMQNNKPPKYLPIYNYKCLLNEVNLFTEWFLKEKNIVINNSSLIKWENTWLKVLKNLKNNKIVLRDFHADNLFWLPNRNNIKRVGLIDFQDATIGNEAYDISSLLEDVRRNVSNDIKKACLQKFISLNNIKDKNKFIKNYYILTAQRNAKIVGIFIRLARKEKKLNYLKLVNRAMTIFLDSLKKAELNEVQSWIENNIPKNKLFYRESNE